MKKYRYANISNPSLTELLEDVNALNNIGKNCRLVSVVYKEGSWYQGVLEFELN